MSSATEISRLTYRMTQYDGNSSDSTEDIKDIVVHKWPQFAQEMKEFVDRLRKAGLEFEYQGESVPALTLKVLLKLLKLKRTHLSNTEKAAIKEAQDG